MSFRTRLTLFFVVIVVVPMLAVALVLFRLVSEAETGKARAALAQASRDTVGLFEEFSQRAGETAGVIGADRQLATALQRRNVRRARQRLSALVERTPAVRARIVLPGAPPIEVGDEPAVAPATRRLIAPGGGELGRLDVSVTTAQSFAAFVARLTALDVVLRTGAGERLAGTFPATPQALPAKGDVDIGGATFEIASFTGPAFDGGRVRLYLLADRDQQATATTESSLVVGAALLGFLMLAFLFAITVSRSLQAQIARLLDAARQLGRGDFAVSVPTEGADEFAALGREFNEMARQLEDKIGELQTERARLQNAIRRIGEAFASNLDRDALLDIVVQTAVDGVGADCGRATVRGEDGALIERSRSGDLVARADAVHAVEAEALTTCTRAEHDRDGVHAITQPITLGTETGDRLRGLLTVVRGGRPFSDGERELVTYLATQAGISLENVDLHETVRRQAVTDELTGLSNHRRFQEVMTLEIERARRFDANLGLIMLDVDNFKSVNDRYGHLQGDLVLREVARVLRESAREIDEPARYGGEEMAVALPETDAEGAFQFAERVRRGIESLEIPLVDGDGVLKVTASFGAASVPATAVLSKAELVAAADEAMYEAKRSGKNKTVRAQGVGSRR